MSVKYYYFHPRDPGMQLLRSHLGLKVHFLKRRDKTALVLQIYDRISLRSKWNKLAHLVPERNREYHVGAYRDGTRKLYLTWKGGNRIKIRVVVTKRAKKSRRGGAGLDIGDFQIKNRNKTESLQGVLFHQNKDGTWTRVASSHILAPGSKSYRLFYRRASEFGVSTYLLVRNPAQDADFPSVISNDLVLQWPMSRKHKITFPTFRTIELF